MLKSFFASERRRVFTPSPGFSSEVMVAIARSPARPAPREGIWDALVLEARRTFAFSLALVVLLLTVQTFVPVRPTRGIIAAYLASKQSMEERFLHRAAAGDVIIEILERLIWFEDGDAIGDEM